MKSICQKTNAPHRYFGFRHESRCLDCETLESNERASEHYVSAITGTDQKRRDQLIAGLRKSQ
jgi:hypothetical protein